MKNKDKKNDTNPFSEEIFPENLEEDNKQENIEEIVFENNIENEKTEKELEELKNQYVRLAADFDNYRKRQMQERESLLKYGAEDTLKKLLPVVDTLERAQKAIQDTEDPKQLKESFDIIYKQFVDALDKSGVKKIETEGKEFDPNIHEAVMQTPTNDHEDHTIIQELQSGYLLEDRVLRAALVNVAVSE